MSDYNLNKNDLYYSNLINRTNVFKDEIIFAISDLNINSRVDMTYSLLNSYHLNKMGINRMLRKSEFFTFLVNSEYFNLNYQINIQ